MKEQNIGFLGGSFDPIHYGHIHLALELQERYQLDAVLFCPAFLSPAKQEDPPQASAEERLAMVSLALEGLPQFSILDHEIKRQGISYTIDTIRALIEESNLKQEKKKFHLLLGDDALENILPWHEIEELFLLSPPLIGSRTGVIPTHLPPLMTEKVRKGFTRMPILDISSTLLRERLKKKLYCAHLMPAKVLDYIYENQLYYS